MGSIILEKEEKKMLKGKWFLVLVLFLVVGFLFTVPAMAMSNGDGDDSPGPHGGHSAPLV